MNSSLSIPALSSAAHSDKETIMGYRNFYLKVIVATLFLNVVVITVSFSQTATTSNVLISNTATVTVKGDFLDQAGTVIQNNGTIELTGNWTNNSGNSGFGSSAGIVVMNGGNQDIGGSSATIFNNLTLAGTGTKKLLTDSETGGAYANPAGIADIGNVMLDLNSHTLRVHNPVPTAITSSAGFIRSEDAGMNGMVEWSINNNAGVHVVPFGNNNGAKIPVTFNLTSGSAGNVNFATYATPPDNTPLPSTPVPVTHLRDQAGLDNSANTVDRFWLVESDGGSAVADLTLAYGIFEQAATGNTGMQSQRWNQPMDGWEASIPGQYYPTPFSVTTPGVSNFGVWAIARGATPLPIELLNYDVKLTSGRHARNSWTTSSELNNDHFTVERSADGNFFEPVGVVAAAGSTTEQQYYNFDDRNPLKGVSYYRLAQSDYDGVTTYSDVRSIRILDEKQYTVEVYPNPVTEKLRINSSAEGSIYVSVSDIKGRIVLQSESAEPSMEMNVSSLSAGEYFLTVSGNEQEKGNTVRIIKQ